MLVLRRAPVFLRRPCLPGPLLRPWWMATGVHAESARQKHTSASTKPDASADDPQEKVATESNSYSGQSASAEKTDSPLNQLARVDELRRRTAVVNRRLDKQAIIGEYPDLRELLEFIYDTRLRFGVRPQSLQMYLGSTSPESVLRLVRPDSESIPDTLLNLFRALQRLSGNWYAARFVIKHGIWKGVEEEEEAKQAAVAAGVETPFETFSRLLGRSLNAGWSARTLKDVQWGDSSSSATLSTTYDKFPVALGKPIQPPFNELFKTMTVKWYASRKLDGVRCLVYIDVRIMEDTLELDDIRFLSRAGNEFTSLGKLRRYLEGIVSFPQLRTCLDRDSVIIKEVEGGVVKRLVLDGELCVLKPTAEGYVEDFSAIVSQVRRKNTDVDNPAYFLLDVLSWCEFNGILGNGGPTTFMDRHRDAQALSAFFGEDTRDGVALKLLPQVPAWTKEDVDAMIERATTEGWEGVVFRADAVYKGGRSSDLYKFKQWQDAEYTVVGLDTSVQRLSVGGVYGEHLAMSNVWIEHKGHRVSVGSGFTTEQRLRYAANPNEIIGKQITVEYFEESTAAGREEASLRFPRVKTVWDEGKRSV